MNSNIQNNIVYAKNSHQMFEKDTISCCTQQDNQYIMTQQGLGTGNMGNLTTKVGRSVKDESFDELLKKFKQTVSSIQPSKKPSFVLLSVEDYMKLQKEIGLPDISSLRKVDIKDF